MYLNSYYESSEIIELSIINVKNNNFHNQDPFLRLLLSWFKLCTIIPDAKVKQFDDKRKNHYILNKLQKKNIKNKSTFKYSQ